VQRVGAAAKLSHWLRSLYYDFTSCTEQNMSEDLRHECGVVALYWLDEAPSGAKGKGKIAKGDAALDVASMLPGMLLDLQNRGQLSSGFSTYNPQRAQLLDTFKDVGGVAEVFRTSHPSKNSALLKEYAGLAGIGHTRYAQPFERHHARRWKWFSFAFNGQLANYAALRDQRGYHFSLDTDTEIIMHALAYGLRGERRPSLKRVMRETASLFDGAFNIVYLDAEGSALRGGQRRFYRYTHPRAGADGDG
jgi:amidophosphoribosyltransferase